MSEEFVNFYKSLDELDGRLSREENYEKLLEAARIWNKRSGSKAQIKQHLINEALKIFKEPTRYVTYREKLIERELEPLVQLAIEDGILSAPEEKRIVDQGIKVGLTEEEIKDFISSRGISVTEEPTSPPPDSGLIAEKTKGLAAKSEALTLGFALLGVLILIRFPAREAVSLSGLSSWIVKSFLLLTPALAAGFSNILKGNKYVWAGIGFGITVALAMLVRAGSGENELIANMAGISLFTTSLLILVTSITTKVLRGQLIKHLYDYKVNWKAKSIAIIKPLTPGAVIILILAIMLAISLVTSARFGSQGLNLISPVREVMKESLSTLRDATMLVIGFFKTGFIPLLQSWAEQIDLSSIFSIIFSVITWTFYSSIALFAILQVTKARDSIVRRGIKTIFKASLVGMGIMLILQWASIGTQSKVISDIIRNPPESVTELIARNRYFLIFLGLLIYWNFFTRFRLLAVLIGIFVGIPLLSGQVEFPSDFSAVELGTFVSSFVSYWQELVNQLSGH